MKQEGWGYIAARIREEDRGFTSPCWIWQLSLTEKGYGRTKVPGLGKVRIHRAAYEIHVGPIPEGLVTDHLCRVRACCNPAHLELVTTAENTRRGLQCRERTECRRGHPLPSGKTQCRICRNAYMREWNKKNRPWLTRPDRIGREYGDQPFIHPEMVRQRANRGRGAEQRPLPETHKQVTVALHDNVAAT